MPTQCQIFLLCSSEPLQFPTSPFTVVFPKAPWLVLDTNVCVFSALYISDLLHRINSRKYLPLWSSQLRRRCSRFLSQRRTRLTTCSSRIPVLSSGNWVEGTTVPCRRIISFKRSAKLFKFFFADHKFDPGKCGVPNVTLGDCSCNYCMCRFRMEGVYLGCFSEALLQCIFLPLIWNLPVKRCRRL